MFRFSYYIVSRESALAAAIIYVIVVVVIVVQRGYSVVHSKGYLLSKFGMSDESSFFMDMYQVLFTLQKVNKCCCMFMKISQVFFTIVQTIVIKSCLMYRIFFRCFFSKILLSLFLF